MVVHKDLKIWASLSHNMQHHQPTSLYLYDSLTVHSQTLGLIQNTAIKFYYLIFQDSFKLLYG